MVKKRPPKDSTPITFGTPGANFNQTNDGSIEEEMRFKEVQELDPASNEMVTKVYLVHPVNHLSDSMTKICFHYKVSNKLVKQVNDLHDDNIAIKKELLIPCQDVEAMKKIGLLKT